MRAKKFDTRSVWLFFGLAGVITAILAVADFAWSAMFVEHEGVLIARGSYATAITYRPFERLGVRYAYDWNGKRYESAEISSSMVGDEVFGGWKYRRARADWPATAKDFVARHPVGSSMKVYVNRFAPATSALVVDGLVPGIWLPLPFLVAGLLVKPTGKFLRARGITKKDSAPEGRKNDDGT